MLDLNELFGMAHFCEYMTMVSNEKYPNELIWSISWGEWRRETSRSLDRFVEYFI